MHAMNIIRIQYTVSREFAEANKKNIGKVMEELRSSNHPEIRYSSYVFNDGKTFMHVFISPDKESQKIIDNLESFKHFQMELKASRPEAPPQFENLTLVGSSYDLLV
jgi:hypothetical protein